MNGLVPAAPQSLTAPLTDPAGGSVLTRIRSFTAQEPVKKALPAFLGLSAVGAAALAWAQLAPSSQRMLYTDLADSDRAAVVQMLDSAGIDYSIDNATGALTVPEDDYYRARMLVAQDGSIGTPESGAELLDSLPLGASRTMEGERLRAARERELQLTIGEIDAVESVRVHLAEAERSAFVRNSVPPTASVMLRLARGRSLSPEQVRAIVNLVAASVPGLAIDHVRIVDQHGTLLSDPATTEDDRIDRQARMEAKLRSQLTHLLTPMFGEGNFSSEIQVELDMDEVTRASETYGKDGRLRSESVQSATNGAAAPAAGIPGALSNTPPPDAQAQDRAPTGTENAAAAAPTQSGETAATRNYELDREVAVANSAPGGLKRLSVAVALSAEAMKDAKASDIDQIKALIGSAVGVNEARGDRLTVMVRSFEPVTTAPLAFYETSWFARLVRYGAALLAVLLVLLLAVRPLIKALKKPAAKDAANTPALEATEGEADGENAAIPPGAADLLGQLSQRDQLDRKVGLARQMVSEQPESAVAALRQMLRDDAPVPESRVSANPQMSAA